MGRKEKKQAWEHPFFLSGWMHAFLLQAGKQELIVVQGLLPEGPRWSDSKLESWELQTLDSMSHIIHLSALKIILGSHLIYYCLLIPLETCREGKGLLFLVPHKDPNRFLLGNFLLSQRSWLPVPCYLCIECQDP